MGTWVKLAKEGKVKGEILWDHDVHCLRESIHGNVGETNKGGSKGKSYGNISLWIVMFNVRRNTGARKKSRKR